MNLNDPKHPWARLTAAARQVQDDRETSAPHGFPTRIAALGLAQQRSFGLAALFERFSLRAVGLASLLAILSLALNYGEIAPPAVASNDVEGLVSDDAIALMVDLDLSTD